MAETIVSMHALYTGKGGRSDGFLSRPIAPGRWPAIVIGHEWWGLVDWSREFNRIMAAEGFVALTPDLFHGQSTSDFATAGKLKTSLDVNAAVQEMIDAVPYLKSLPFVSDRVGVMGFCMGGGLAILAACRSANFDAAVIFHHSIWPDPKEVEKLSCPLQGHYGLADTTTAPAEAQKFENQLKQFKKVNEVYYYEGAGHGWLDPADKQRHRPEVAKLSMQRTIEFFKKHLGDKPK